MDLGSHRLRVRWVLFGVLIECFSLSAVDSWSVVRIERTFHKGSLRSRISQDWCDGMNTAMIKRDEWDALPARRTFDTTGIAKDVVVWQTGPDTCQLLGLVSSNCQRCLHDGDCLKRGILVMQQDDLENGLDDIRYNFIIDERGVIYEGRGWSVDGQQTLDKNGRSLDVALVGDFTDAEPTLAAQDSLNRLVLCGMRSNKLLYGSELNISPSKAGGAFHRMTIRCGGLCV